MTGPGEPDGEMSAADRAWADLLCEISQEYPGVEVTRDQWGGLWYRLDGGERAGPVSCPLALRAMIGNAKPRKATP